MGCFIIVWNVEAWQRKNMGDTSQTHIHGYRKIWQQTRRWYQTEQEVETKNNGHRIHQRTCHLYKIEKMYKMIEKHTENCKRYIPLIGGDFHAELGPRHGNESISVGRYTLNVTGWNIGWCYKNTQHSTRWKGKHLRNKRPSFLHKETKNKLTTYWPREDTWDTLKMPRPTTWSTWEVTTDVSWLLSRSPCQERTSTTRIQGENTTWLNMSNATKQEKTLKPWSLSSEKSTRRSLKNN